MNRAAEEALVEAAMILREGAPDAWDGFVRALRAYSQVTAENLVRAHADLLVASQGRAQAVADLTHLLADAPGRFDVMVRGRRRG